MAKRMTNKQLDSWVAKVNEIQTRSRREIKAELKMADERLSQIAYTAPEFQAAAEAVLKLETELEDV